MKLPNFLGGTDEQRSNNISDARLINLYPVTNNDGTVQALHKVDGLKSEGTLAGVPTGAYKASNGRAFYVTGTTLYELTVPAGVYTSTSRGTVTAGTYDFSDNGIELICVNGTDGWLLVFATNTLSKIKVLSNTVTITVATPAILTSVAHGLADGDRVLLSSTGSLPSPFTGSTPYYVIAAGLTADAFELSLTLAGTAINTGLTATSTCVISTNTGTGGTCTISNGTPATITKAGHGYTAGNVILFNTTGGLPNGLLLNTLYYVLAPATDTFTVALTVGGTAINTTSAGTGVQSIINLSAGTIYDIDGYDLNIGDEIKFTTTGALPTGIVAGTSYYLTSTHNFTLSSYTEIGPIFGELLTFFVFTSSSNTLNFGTKIRILCSGVYPTGILPDTDYYIVNIYDRSIPGNTGLKGISETPSGSAKLYASPGTGSLIAREDNTFGIVAAAVDIYGTRIVASSTQSGVQSYYTNAILPFGTHTFTTLGYGFPNGCKTISYLNGRFVACEPSTQNFYVSEVLDGWYWDAINVQTVDSNPDLLIGQTVSHNELIMFCENSGEVFYDSGTFPTPFVRNSSGIFEVGCIAPYTITNLDNTVYWLGNSNEGSGIIYKLNGYTPQRISTYSIEQAIQAMTTVSDARAFAYQKDGHHYYVLTFPTGNKTFVFDVNTQLWHERAQATWTHSAIPPSMSWVATASAITDFYPQNIAWNGSVYCVVGWSGSGTGITRCYTSPDGITWTVRTLPTSGTWAGIAWNGTVFCAVSGVGTAAATSPDGITWTARTLPTSTYWSDIVYANSQFVAVGSQAGIGSYCATSPDGITWTARTITSYPFLATIISYGNGIYVATGITSGGSNTTTCSTSPDGITWTSRTIPSGYYMDCAWNGTVFCAVARHNNGASTISATSPDGITWTARTLPESADWSGIDVISGLFCIVNQTNNNSYISEDGITWTLEAIPGSLGGFSSLGNNGSLFVTVGFSSPVISALSSVPVVTPGSYVLSYWPVTKYLYFNNKHLTTDTTTSLSSIDSSTYKNGTNPIRYVRSFIAPPSDMKRVVHSLFELEAETGVGATTADVINLRWSNDNGNTWNTDIPKELGLSGDYARRINWHRLGLTKGYPRIYEISGTSDTKIVLLAAYLS